MKASICICISGFKQTRGRHNGILELREELIAAGHNSGIESRVWYLPWTSNWSDVAGDLSIICAQHGLTPNVLIAGYSYGGWGAIRLCNSLWERGIKVQALILSDPVARPWYMSSIPIVCLPSITSMLGREYSFSMRIPGNVRELYEYYQTTNRPQGHRLIISNGTDYVHSVKLNKRHDQMDDAKEFHGCVLKCASGMSKLHQGT